MSDVGPSRTIRVTRFVGEWLFIATLPISLPFVILSALAKGLEKQALEGPLPTAALCGYVIALSYAFLRESSIRSWQLSSSFVNKLLGSFLELAKLLLVPLSVTFIVLATLEERVRVLNQVVQGGYIFSWAAMMGITAVCLAFIVVLRRPMIYGELDE